MKVSDKVTLAVAFYSSIVQLHRGRVCAIGEGLAIIRAPDGREHIVWLAEEGVSWMRGHHEDNSDEAKALLVARALFFT